MRIGRVIDATIVYHLTIFPFIYFYCTRCLLTTNLIAKFWLPVSIDLFSREKGPYPVDRKMLPIPEVRGSNPVIGEIW